MNYWTQLCRVGIHDSCILYSLTMKTSGIDKIVFNGKTTKPLQLKTVIDALADDVILADKGGYIFSLHFAGEILYIGILPYFIGDERSHHYDIELPKGKYNLIGFVNTDKSIQLFFKLSPEECAKGLNEEDLSHLRENYVRFARLLMELNFPGDTKLCVVTQNLLQQQNIISPPPDDVAELANTSLEQ